jgi:putative membrane protein
MKRASQLFTAEERARIEAAVREAELKTSAEIVPVVATASGRYDRAEDLVGLWCGILLMGLTWWFFPRAEAEAMWTPWWLALELPALIAAMLIGFVVGAVIASRVQGLRYLFTPKSEMEAEVLGRARQAFYDQRVHRTAGGTGLLIFVSLYERTAAIVADDVVVEKLGQTALDALCGQLTSAMKSGHAADAFVTTITDTGERLGAVLPRDPRDVNELPNTLCIID